MTEAETRAAVTREFQALTRWTSALTWADIPEDIRQRAALILADDFGALIAARDEPELIALRAGLARAAGAPEATVFDAALPRQDRYSAALSNGAAADWCELDGGYRLAICHAALYCLPALLAEAEAERHSLQHLLLSLIVGYETVARVARCFAFPGLVMHPHGGLATVGAAAAIARMRGLDAETTAAAICTGATLVLPGPFGHAVEGALIRNVWPGLCAQNGIRSADWAAIGVAGGPDSLFDVFARIMGATATPAALSVDLGQTWAMQDAYHKMHACCQYAHSTVEAVLAALRDAGPVTPDQVAAIDIATHWKGRKLDNPQPATTLAAKFSIQHIAAATLAFGHAGAAAFHADTLRAPALMRLRGLVSISAHEPEQPWPHDRPARATLRLTDGRELVGECLSAPGGADLPYGPDQITQKALGLMAPLLPGADRVIPQVLALEGARLAQSWPDLLADLRG
ncbi:MmgE/PrpD family protein [Phaeovulum sp. NW3]|uniref:MmgE/PrpD family protein n=1 Tax=Phaeovulum sp. NW3 TaxID=2934933 RepID=UPI00202212CD|nr:MmgE/PrpD family protein [Phaeovulum sp. NW3]MCL7466434.1 MmgE/PrpD family protein [Phaeovulum sp. NW3]